MEKIAVYLERGLFWLTTLIYFPFVFIDKILEVSDKICKRHKWQFPLLMNLFNWSVITVILVLIITIFSVFMSIINLLYLSWKSG